MPDSRSQLPSHPKTPVNLSEWVGRADILLITLDTLRFDAAQAAWEADQLPNLGPHLSPRGWERRHTPASFTYAAHHAFFAGFLPTPEQPGQHSRLFASRFAGSETTTEKTFVFDQPTLPEALSALGYRTICVGGTGFFNPSSELGKVLPSLFDESHWSPQLGVADPMSEVHQVSTACERFAEYPDTPVFMFINISAIHQPNWFYASQQERPDDLQSHTAALVAVDRALAPLFKCCRDRRDTFCVVCSDHGTAYGENGYTGHRLAHDSVWTVPYTEFML